MLDLKEFINKYVIKRSGTLFESDMLRYKNELYKTIENITKRLKDIVLLMIIF